MKLIHFLQWIDRVLPGNIYTVEPVTLFFNQEPLDKADPNVFYFGRIFIPFSGSASVKIRHIGNFEFDPVAEWPALDLPFLAVTSDTDSQFVGFRIRFRDPVDQQRVNYEFFGQ